MRAVLMAGGSGTRLRPLTCDLPKPMVPILNKPIAEHIINLLKTSDHRNNSRLVLFTRLDKRLLSRRRSTRG